MTGPEITYAKHLAASPAHYPQLAKGQPCEKGETAAKSGCIPAEGEGGMRERTKKASENLRSRLSKSEMWDIERYTGEGKIAAGLNKKLREGNMGDLSSEESRTLKSFESALRKVGAQSPPLVLYRRVELPAAQGSTLEEEVRGGRDIVLSGLISTTSKDYHPLMNAPPFDKSKKSIVYKITTPAGLPVSSVSPHPDEHEVILGHNWRYKPTGVSKDRLGETILHLEVVNTDSAQEGMELAAQGTTP